MNNTKRLLFLFFITVAACINAQESNTLKTFDIETFNKHKDHLNHYNFITTDSTYIEQSRWQFGFE